MTAPTNPGPKSSSVILITKQLRMDWMDVMALDKRLSATAFRVAGVIGTHFGNKSGMTYVSRQTLARVTGMSEATIKRAIMELSGLGYFKIERREIGVRKDGRKAFGAKGKGGANVYLPAVDAEQISATNRGQRLIQRAEQSWDEIRNKSSAKRVTDDPLRSTKQVTDDPLSDGHSGSNDNPMWVTGDPPTLSSPTEKNSSRARGPSRPDGLGPAGALLRQRLGDEVYRSWFGRVEIEAETAGCVTLVAPTKFSAIRIRQDYELKIIEAWQAINPSINRVLIVVRKESAA